MSWFPVDDAFHGHPKARRAGLEALGLWVVSGSYAMAYLTNGFVPAWFVHEKPKGKSLSKRLVDAGLWIVGERDGEPGWWFHDWKPECTKEHIEDVRKKMRQRKAKSRESHSLSRVTGRETNAGKDAGVLGYIQPNPTQPITSRVNLGREGPQSNAHDAPRPQCPDHEENHDGPCHACRRRRRWDETHAAAVQADELERRRADKTAAAQVLAKCPSCDDSGWLLAADGTPAEPALRCRHTSTLVNDR